MDFFSFLAFLLICPTRTANLSDAADNLTEDKKPPFYLEEKDFDFGLMRLIEEYENDYKQPLCLPKDSDLYPEVSSHTHAYPIRHSLCENVVNDEEESCDAISSTLCQDFPTSENIPDIKVMFCYENPLFQHDIDIKYQKCDKIKKEEKVYKFWKKLQNADNPKQSLKVNKIEKKTHILRNPLVQADDESFIKCDFTISEQSEIYQQDSNRIVDTHDVNAEKQDIESLLDEESTVEKIKELVLSDIEDVIYEKDKSSKKCLSIESTLKHDSMEDEFANSLSTKSIKLIGEGSFGSVYKAHDPVKNVFVAIKLIQPRKKKILSLEDQEIQALQILKHKNIVFLFDAHLIDGDLYLIMEYAPQILKSYCGQLEHIDHFMRQLIEGVDYIHSQGIIHRDLKPENILVTDDLVLKITDFGMCHMQPEGKITEMMYCTLFYRAPELFFSNTVYGQSVDIYSIGMIAFKLYTKNYFFRINDDSKYIQVLSTFLINKSNFKNNIYSEVNDDNLAFLIYGCCLFDQNDRLKMKDLKAIYGIK